MLNAFPLFIKLTVLIYLAWQMFDKDYPLLTNAATAALERGQ